MNVLFSIEKHIKLFKLISLVVKHLFMLPLISIYIIGFILDPSLARGFALKAGRRKMPGWIPERACRSSSSNFLWFLRNSCKYVLASLRNTSSHGGHSISSLRYFVWQLDLNLQLTNHWICLQSYYLQLILCKNITWYVFKSLPVSKS